MEAVTGILLDGGFTVDLAHHAMHVLGSRVLGFSQDLYDDAGVPDPEMAAAWAAQLASVYPNIGALAMTASHEDGIGGCDDDYEFAFGLDLILDGLERRRVTAAGWRARPMTSALARHGRGHAATGVVSVAARCRSRSRPGRR